MNCLSLHCFVEVRCNFVTLFQGIAAYRRRPGILAESVNFNEGYWIRCGDAVEFEGWKLGRLSVYDTYGSCNF